jgi:uncharacterized repeat protein (TIGR04052 family)
MKKLTLLMALSALALGCGDNSSEPGTQEVELSFQAMVGDEAFACGETYSNLGADNTTIVLSDFRFYIQEVELKNAAGIWVPLELDESRWQSGGVALLDFEDCAAMGNIDLNDLVTGSVPAGDYDGLRFKMGVPFEMNHTDHNTAKSPLNITALFWIWQSGYKFLRIDSGQFSGTDWRMHLGSTGCEGDPMVGGVTSCANGNRPEVQLESFDPASNTVVADYAKLVEGASLDVGDSNPEEGDDPGCMSKPADTDCAPLFENLGLSFAGSTPGPQQFFSAE